MLDQLHGTLHGINGNHPPFTIDSSEDQGKLQRIGVIAADNR